MSTWGEYHEYIGGVQYTGGYHSVHQGITMSTPGDSMMHVSTSAGYHEHNGGIP